MASLFVACLGVLPYVHFSILHRTDFLPLAIFFPICRVVGGLLCVFPGQLLLQYRIKMIMKQRLLFKAINDVLEEHNARIPIQHLLWDHTHSSDACLSSLIDFLGRRPTTTRFVEHVARALHFPPQSTPKELANRIKVYLTHTWSSLVLTGGLLLGFFMTIVGYIGCFTIVQSSFMPSDTYIWLGAEATLAFVRLLIWGLNPSWDDSDGVCLVPKESSPLPAVTRTSVVIDHEQFPMFKVMSETSFWQAMTAYSGPVDIQGEHIRGSQRYYSWIKGEDAELQLICVIVEGQETVLCRLDHTQDMKFYQADINFNPGHVVQKEELTEDHELMKEEMNFRFDVFNHYDFIISVKNRARASVGPITASWPLSESSISSPRANNAVLRSRDAEQGDQTHVGLVQLWLQLVKIMDEILAGTEPSYKQISTCRGMISNAASSKDLNRRLSRYLSVHTKKIYDGAPWRDDKLKNYYNAKWELYSNGIIYLDRLFQSLTANQLNNEQERSAANDALVNVAVEHWKFHVLRKLETRLRQVTSALDIEVGRVITLFTSEDWTRADFWNMQLKIVRLILEAGLVKGAKQYSKALTAASSSGHIAVVRLLLEKGADINPDGIPVLQTASSSGQLDVVQILLNSGADVNATVPGGEYFTALQAASCHGHEDIVRLLLANGANGGLLGGSYYSALQAASNGHAGIVRLLLKTGADVNALGGKYGSALQVAAGGGYTEIVGLLLENGALIDEGSGENCTALQTACWGGHKETVTLLLQKGANINARGGIYGGALQVASYKGHTEIVSILLEKGADKNAKDGELWTALQAASYKGHEELVHLLLGVGADVNSSGGEYGNALQAAAYGDPADAVSKIWEGVGRTTVSTSHEAIVHLLLEAGADVNRSGGKYGSALQAASYGGHIAIVRLLVEKGADINARGGEYCTALQAASCQNHEEVARFLLKAGADDGVLDIGSQ
ncbi:ankyrin repeat-containing domain protein [Mycena olivaceomarginata]|nr:ankyrin repeat-containing domain protein [Mycena olivaceomarginata]